MLRVEDVHKRFPGVHALRGVSLDIAPGEVHALIGENGAGKSTLIKVLVGLQRPDEGRLQWDGQPLHLRGPVEAAQHGIAAAHQEPALCPDLTALENLYLGRLPSRAGRVRWDEMRARALSELATHGLFVRLSVEAGELSPAERAQVELLRALLHQPRLLILDEPTASLSGDAVERLYAIVRRLRAEGRSVLYVSHRLEEVEALADRVTVLRDGARVGTWPATELTRQEMVRQMVGRPVEQQYPKPEVTPGAVLLEVKALARPPLLRDISFQVRTGEIVGLAGLVGAGRTELARTLFGLDPPESGSVTLAGQPARFASPREAMAAGLAYLPEDRQREGLVLPFTVRQNTTLATLRVFTRGGFLDTRAERAAAERYRERLGVRTPSVEAAVRDLSGGNQQKVALAKWLAARPKALILDEPTRGVDVGAKAEIHRLIGELAAEGMAILMISSDLPEVLGMSDRVLVMRGGTIVADLPRQAATSESVMIAAFGAEVARLT